MDAVSQVRSGQDEASEEARTPRESFLWLDPCCRPGHDLGLLGVKELEQWRSDVGGVYLQPEETKPIHHSLTTSLPDQRGRTWRSLEQSRNWDWRRQAHLKTD